MRDKCYIGWRKCRMIKEAKMWFLVFRKCTAGYKNIITYFPPAPTRWISPIGYIFDIPHFVFLSHMKDCTLEIHYKIYESHEGIWGSTNNRKSKSLYYGLVIQSLDLHNSFSWIAICSLDLLNSIFSSCNSFPQIVPLIYIICSARLKLQSKGTNCVNRWNE